MADAFDEGRVLSQLPAMELVRIEQTDRETNRIRPCNSILSQERLRMLKCGYE